MRLSETEQHAIADRVRKHFGSDADVRLFGSRADDTARGGDIDLYIETELTGQQALTAEMRLQWDLQEALGEQRIDLVVRSRGELASPFEQYARAQGVPL